jgi:hypothetical protein
MQAQLGTKTHVHFLVRGQVGSQVCGQLFLQCAYLRVVFQRNMYLYELLHRDHTLVMQPQLSDVKLHVLFIYSSHVYMSHI